MNSEFIVRRFLSFLLVPAGLFISFYLLLQITEKILFFGWFQLNKPCPEQHGIRVDSCKNVEITSTSRTNR